MAKINNKKQTNTMGINVPVRLFKPLYTMQKTKLKETIRGAKQGSKQELNFMHVGI